MAKGHSNEIQRLECWKTKDGKRQRVLVVFMDHKGVARLYLDVWQFGARCAPPTLVRQGTRGVCLAALEAEAIKLSRLHVPDDLGTEYFKSTLTAERFGLSGVPQKPAAPAPKPKPRDPGPAAIPVPFQDVADIALFSL